MAVPQPPRPGQAVYVQFTEPYGECGGCVTRVVGHDVYVCYEGEAHEYEEPLDWTNPAVRRIVRVKTTVATQPPRQDRRSRAEKATGWGGPSRRRRRRAVPQREPKPDGDRPEEQAPGGSPVTSSGSAPFVRTPSGRLVATSPERADTILIRRTASHQLLEHSHETLLSQEQRLEAEARRLEEDLERELRESIEALRLGEAAIPVERPGSEGDADKHSQQHASCGELAVHLASPTPEANEDMDEQNLEHVDWKTECRRLRERENDHLRQIRDQDRQIRVLQTMLRAAAGLVGKDSDERCCNGQLALTG